MKILAMLGLLLFAQGQAPPREIPPCAGKECEGAAHDWQPAWCQNSDGDGYKKNCDCKRSCDRDDRGSDCRTWCRTPRCKCDHGCPRTR